MRNDEDGPSEMGSESSMRAYQQPKMLMEKQRPKNDDDKMNEMDRTIPGEW